jgi:hypothetical protein
MAFRRSGGPTPLISTEMKAFRFRPESLGALNTGCGFVIVPGTKTTE